MMSNKFILDLVTPTRQIFLSMEVVFPEPSARLVIVVASAPQTGDADVPRADLVQAVDFYTTSDAGHGAQRKS